MPYRIGIESGSEGRTVAWALGHPGCYAYGATDDDALAACPAAIRAYADWIGAHTKDNWLSGPVDVQLEETWQVYTIGEDFELADEGYGVDAWFRHDWKPLTEEDVARGLLLLDWTRADLLAAVEGLSSDARDVRAPGERWSIDGILRHVGGAEWWYLDRLGLAFPRSEVPDGTLDRLEKARARLREVLPGLAGSKQVVGVDGEFWSPRKLLRRAVWHERDHTGHIERLVREGQLS